MKKLVLLTILLFSFGFLSLAQERFGKIRCDSFQVTTDTSIALIFRRKKTALFNRVSREFLIKPTKDRLIYLPESELVAIVNESEIKLFPLSENQEIPVSTDISVKDKVIYTRSKNGKLVYLKSDEQKMVLHSKSEEPGWDKLDLDSSGYAIDVPRNDHSIIFGLERINDSLIRVYNHESDQVDPFSGPLKSVVYPEEDSIEYGPDGYDVVVYPAPKPGHYNDGVYNLKTRNWFIKPSYLIKTITSEGIFYLDDIRDDVHGSLIDQTGSFKKYNGDFEFKSEAYENLIDNTEALATIFECEQVFKAQIGQASHSRISEYAESYYYGQTKKGYKIIHTEYGFDQCSQEKEFVYYNPDNKIYFWLENDSLYAFDNTRVYATGTSDNEMKMTIIPSYPENVAVLEIIEKEDTVQIPIQLEDTQAWIENEFFTSLSILGNRLIVNNTDHFNTIDGFAQEMWDSGFYEEIYGYNLSRFMTESASVWEKTNGQWNKMTTDYARVDRLQFGYLAQTGAYFNVVTIPDEVEEVESRFVLLDSNYSAMSFMDFYDFETAVIHDFGVQLCTGKGCFLVGNNGIAITADEWDTFELEGDKIKAIRYLNLTEEEIWEYEELIEEVKYFEIPE